MQAGEGGSGETAVAGGFSGALGSLRGWRWGWVREGRCGGVLGAGLARRGVLCRCRLRPRPRARLAGTGAARWCLVLSHSRQTCRRLLPIAVSPAPPPRRLPLATDSTATSPLCSPLASTFAPPSRVLRVLSLSLSLCLRAQARRRVAC